jgi:carboxypeptidase family protein
VKLSSAADPSHAQDAESDDDGQYTFVGVTPGPFQLTVTSEGFGTQTYSGTLRSAETVVPPITLLLETEKTEVRVSMSPIEVAQAEMKDEEKQRVLGIVPNFYVTYDPAAPPLAPKQKFELAWRATIDPINLGLAAGVAGIEHATNRFPEWGQGGDGYAKRFGAAYADFAIGTFIGSAILPAAFKQDPRYFYRGTGSVRSRFLYALSAAVICKGDSGHWQANYSGILGGVAAAGISNLYYPSTDQSRAALTFENALIGIGSTAVANVLQEFVIRKLTPHAPKYSPASP